MIAKLLRLPRLIRQARNLANAPTLAPSEPLERRDIVTHGFHGGTGVVQRVALSRDALGPGAWVIWVKGPLVTSPPEEVWYPQFALRKVA